VARGGRKGGLELLMPFIEVVEIEILDLHVHYWV
jgi:hypothetical protein